MTSILHYVNKPVELCSQLDCYAHWKNYFTDKVSYSVTADAMEDEDLLKKEQSLMQFFVLKVQVKQVIGYFRVFLYFIGHFKAQKKIL